MTVVYRMIQKMRVGSAEPAQETDCKMFSYVDYIQRKEKENKMSDPRKAYMEARGDTPKQTEVEKNLGHLFDEILQNAELVSVLYKDLSKVLSNEPVSQTEVEPSEPPILTTCHISQIVVDKIYVIRESNDRLKIIRKDLRI